MPRQEATVDVQVFSLTFAVDDTVEYGSYVISVQALETYNYAEETVETASVSAEVTITETTAVAGDIDGDGFVSIADALKLIRVILNNQTIANADVNGDGKVGIADVIRIMKLIAQ